jgi:hypothetical protein
MDLADKGWGAVDWIGLSRESYKWRALVNAVVNLRSSIECWENIEWLHN